MLHLSARSSVAVAVAALGLTALPSAHAAAAAPVVPAGAVVVTSAITGTQFIITSRDAAGVGFNDATPTTPVGGNNGTTLGEQRWNVYKHVAGVWADKLTSTVPITVSAAWEALTCTANSAVLGSASSWNGWSDFVGAPKAGTWYPSALANKLAGLSLTDYYGQEDDGTGYGNVDIKTQFNVNLGKTGCLDGGGFYLGLDGQEGSATDFAATLLHELGHGLGFSLFTTSSASGARYADQPSIWEGFMYDNTQQRSWLDMTNAQRAASAINPLKLAWTGAQAVAGAATTLGQAPVATISGADAGPLAGDLAVGPAQFGRPFSAAPLTGQVVQMVDQTNGTGLACTPLSAANAARVAGKIALVDRGTCTFVVKVKNLQNAGAIGALVADNVVALISDLGGADSTITIPAARLMKTDADRLKAQLAVRSRTRANVVQATLWLKPGTKAGADAAGRPLLYTPNPREPGSSVSHWTTSASPNQLMEPAISKDLTLEVTPPKDLTLPLLKDLGW